MASTVLYPPIVDGYIPAFEVYPINDVFNRQNFCKIYFDLSKYNASSDFAAVHVSIIRQSSGLSAVSALVEEGSTVEHPYRATGIILDVPFDIDNNGRYYVTIPSEDINGNYTDYKGWIPGEIYKIQLRLSSERYENTGKGVMGQSAWLVQNANKFSEWSTISVTKAIADKKVLFTTVRNSEDNSVVFDPATAVNAPEQWVIYNPEFRGEYQSALPDNEGLHSYEVSLLEGDESGAVLDTSGIIYSNQYINQNELKYTFNSEIVNGKIYTIKVRYETINGYAEELFATATGITNQDWVTDLILVTAENDPDGLLNTTEFMEDEDGRVSLLVVGTETAEEASGKYYIRRSSSKTNFKIWEDIKLIDVTGLTNVNQVFYDYTLESGVFYKYGIQLLDSAGDRGNLKVIENPVYRDFNYSFLLGENEKQLKLAFNNSVDSYKVNVSDSMTTTIGGQYPFITRNGSTKYRTIPVNGLISFNMDENNLFVTDKDIYKYDAIVKMHAERRGVPTQTLAESAYRKASDMYDRTYERDFRNQVIEFLNNGKPKLFKSATEGNILVRLMDVNCSPVQGLNRLVYSFTATGQEIADASQKILSKYNIAILDGGAGATPASEKISHSHKLEQGG